MNTQYSQYTDGKNQRSPSEASWGSYPNMITNGMYPHSNPQMAAERLPINPMANSVTNSGGPPGFGAPKVCAGCGTKILERFLLHSMDRYWHQGCLKCSCCGAMLVELGSSCFSKAGMILCKPDYVRMFGSSRACGGCGQLIPPSEFVMRSGQGQVYHLKCFVCAKCNIQLMPGDRYALLNGSLVCEQDSFKLKPGPGSGYGNGATGGTVRKGKVGRPRRNRE